MTVRLDPQPDRYACRHDASSSRPEYGGAFRAFERSFGGSFRTWHVLRTPRTLKERLKLAARAALGRLPSDTRLYPLGKSSPLPADFIQLDPWECEYLFMVASLARKGIVEIGRFAGGSTFLLACANRAVPIWSIDIAPTSDDRLRRLFGHQEVGANVELLEGDSKQEAFPEIGEYDVLFIDGDHSYEGVSADLERFFSELASGGHVVLHDSYRADVRRAIAEFVTDRGVTIFRSPFIISAHWHTTNGSIAHFSKRG